MLRSHAMVDVMQPAEHRRCHELRRPGGIRRFVRNWRLATESLMRPLGMIVVLDELVKEPFEISVSVILCHLCATRAAGSVRIGSLMEPTKAKY